MLAAVIQRFAQGSVALIITTYENNICSKVSCDGLIVYVAGSQCIVVYLGIYIFAICFYAIFKSHLGRGVILFDGSEFLGWRKPECMRHSLAFNF